MMAWSICGSKEISDNLSDRRSRQSKKMASSAFQLTKAVWRATTQ